jgi:hypothetical protein
MSTTTDHAASPQTQTSIFGRVLVGIDDSPESLEAARQAVVLARGLITLLAAYDVTDAVVGGAMPPAPVYLDEGPIRENVETALERARQEVSPVEPVTRSVAADPGRCCSTRLQPNTTPSSPLARTARAERKGF